MTTSTETAADVLCADGCGQPATDERPTDDLAGTAGVELVCRYHLWLPEGPFASRAIDPYRYTLSRGGWTSPLPAFPAWDGERPPGDLVWIMLNPSTATADADDNTIRRVVGFTKGFGYARAVVVNLFAYRVTDPDVLAARVKAGVDVVGPDNDEVISLIAANAQTVVAAWGAQPRIAERVAAVRALVEATGKPLHCVGVSAKGHPRHPLMQRADAPLTRWEPA